MNPLWALLAALAAATLAACSGSGGMPAPGTEATAGATPAGATPTPTSAIQTTLQSTPSVAPAPSLDSMPGPSATVAPRRTFRAVPVLEGAAWPAALAPDGRLFFTQRLAGQVRVLENGMLRSQPFARLPVVQSAETGLLGLAIHPDYPRSPYVYVYYTYRDGQEVFNRVSRVRQVNGLAAQEEIILDRLAAASIHNGGAIAFGPDGKLYIAIGDTTRRQAAQDLGSLVGKVLRLNPDGSIPGDNPFPGSPVYTYGHRNIYGLTFHPATGAPFITENGPSTDDELNVLQAGGNYGWPLALGMADDPRFIDPILTYTPNIAPTGILFYTGDRYGPENNGAFFFGAWNTGSLYRVAFADSGAASAQVVLEIGEGIIALAQGPDGFLYITTASAIMRVQQDWQD